MWYKSYTGLRFHFDGRKDRKLRADRKRGIGFLEVTEIFRQRHYQAFRSEMPEQFLATGWVKERLFSVVYEIREDEQGEFYHLVTLWKASAEEVRLYEETT